jgi:hypothetical protein
MDLFKVSIILSKANMENRKLKKGENQLLLPSRHIRLGTNPDAACTLSLSKARLV